jgi:hypothetical protein
MKLIACKTEALLCLFDGEKIDPVKKSHFKNLICQEIPFSLLLFRVCTYTFLPTAISNVRQIFRDTILRTILFLKSLCCNIFFFGERLKQKLVTKLLR